jgi:hypothetical protein
MTGERWAKAPMSVLEDPRLPPGAVRVWVWLDLQQGSRPWLFWPGGQEAIGERVHMSRATVRRHVDLLIKNGWLAVTQTPRGARYVVHNPARQRDPIVAPVTQSIVAPVTQCIDKRKTRNNNTPPHETGTHTPQPDAVVGESQQGIKTATVAADALDVALDDMRQAYARTFYESLPDHLGNGLNRRSKTISGHLEEARSRRWTPKALAAAVGARLPNGNPAMVTGVLGTLAATDPPKTPKALPRWCGSCGRKAYPDATVSNPPPAGARWIEHDGPPTKCRCHPGHPDNLTADQPAAVA